jgi:Uma2 family endonuclease
MTATTKLMTAAELMDLPDDGQLYELVTGELISMPPPGDEHGGIVAAVTEHLRSHVRSNRLGIVRAGEVGFLLFTNPDTVRAADVAFLRRERVEAEGQVRGYRRGSPDLVVEVVSPSDRYSDVARKVAEWLAGGALMVVVVDPRQRNVLVHRSPTRVQVLTEADTLDGEEVVPGWRMPVAAIFEDLTGM